MLDSSETNVGLAFGRRNRWLVSSGLTNSNPKEIRARFKMAQS